MDFFETSLPNEVPYTQENQILDRRLRNGSLFHLDSQNILLTQNRRGIHNSSISSGSISLQEQLQHQQTQNIKIQKLLDDDLLKFKYKEGQDVIFKAKTSHKKLVVNNLETFSKDLSQISKPLSVNLQEGSLQRSSSFVQLLMTQGISNGDEQGYKKHQLDKFLLSSSNVYASLSTLQYHFEDKKVETVSSFEKESVILNQTMDDLILHLNSQRQHTLSTSKQKLISTLESISSQQAELSSLLIEVEQLYDDVRTNTQNIIDRMTIDPFKSIIYQYTTRVSEIMTRSQNISLIYNSPSATLSSYMQDLDEIHRYISRQSSQLKIDSIHTRGLATDTIGSTILHTSVTDKKQSQIQKSLKCETNHQHSLDSSTFPHQMQREFLSIDMRQNRRDSLNSTKISGGASENIFDISHDSLRKRSQTLSDSYVNENYGQSVIECLPDQVNDKRNSLENKLHVVSLTSIDWVNSFQIPTLNYHSNKKNFSLSKEHYRSQSFTDDRSLQAKNNNQKIKSRCPQVYKQILLKNSKENIDQNRSFQQQDRVQLQDLNSPFLVQINNLKAQKTIQKQ